jgi:iron-sulfur cluster repair protein YtfE (RIC family)
MTATRPATAARPDTREMIVVHNVFRRLFGDLPGLIGQVAEGDTARAARLCASVDELTTGLEHHHTGEDELLWPVLLDRIGPECGTVLRAEEQHGRVHELLELVRTQVPPLRATARGADRDALAATLTELDVVLREHMADEERYVLPLVEEHLTLAEWARWASAAGPAFRRTACSSSSAGCWTARRPPTGASSSATCRFPPGSPGTWPAGAGSPRRRSPSTAADGSDPHRPSQ